MCAMASTRISFLGAEGMRASIAKDEEGTPETVARAPPSNGKRPPRSIFPRGLGDFTRLLLVGLWFRLARSRLRGFSPGTSFALRHKQHPCATVKVHVLPRRSDHRTLGGIRACGAQVQAVQAKHTLAVRSELTCGVQPADGSLRSTGDAPAGVGRRV